MSNVQLICYFGQTVSVIHFYFSTFCRQKLWWPERGCLCVRVLKKYAKTLISNNFILKQLDGSLIIQLTQKNRDTEKKKIKDDDN